MSCCSPVGVPPTCCSLEATLLAGQTTGGTDIVVSTGDSVLGEAELTLAAQGSGGAFLRGGDPAVGPGGPVVIRGGSPTDGDAGTLTLSGGLAATSGPARAGGDVLLTPTAGIAGGATGIARVGANPIITGSVNLGAGLGLIGKGPDTPGIDGANLQLRTLAGIGGIGIVLGVNTISIDGSGISSLPTTFFEASAATFVDSAGSNLHLIFTSAATPALTGETWVFVLSHASSQSVGLSNNARTEWMIQDTVTPTWITFASSTMLPGLGSEMAHQTIIGTAVVAVDNPSLQLHMSRGSAAPTKTLGLGRIFGIRVA